jgi:hypothetical protein
MEGIFRNKWGSTSGPKISINSRSATKFRSQMAMTKPLPFTESAVRRAVSAARKAGLPVNAVSVSPDGTVTVYQRRETPEPQNTPSGDPEASPKEIVL